MSRVNVVETNVAGWPALILASDTLVVSVLPTKGAEIHSMLDRATGVDALLHAPSGLRPPAPPYPQPSDEPEFLRNYAGGWQELFPNTLDACTHAGVPQPVHGEAALRAWTVIQASSEGVKLSFETAGGLRLFRRMRLDPDAPRLALEERVTNVGVNSQEFVWGHHCVLGPPFLNAGCRIHASATTVRTLAAERQAPTARVAGDQEASWPLVRATDGTMLDLREIASTEAASDDDLFVTGLKRGEAVVENPQLGRAFRIDWDVHVFPWLLLWQSYGGADAPLDDLYALGVEPWASAGNLADAVKAGVAHELAPRETLETELTVSYVPGSPWL